MSTLETTPGAEAAAGIQYALRTASGLLRAMMTITKPPATRIDAEPTYILARSILEAIMDAEDLCKQLASDQPGEAP